MPTEWEIVEDQFRSDDPYHAWQYNRRTNGAPGAEGGQANAGTGTLCPVLIYAKPGNDGKITGLRKSLIEIQKLVVNGPFVATDSEQEHLGKALAWITGRDADDTVGPETEYAQLFLFHLKEEDLFRESEWFEILYRGAAIIDVVSQIKLGGLRVGGVKPKAPDTMLAIIDDSIGFLNDAFMNKADANPVSLSRWSEIWFQNVARTHEGVGPEPGFQANAQNLSDMMSFATHSTEFETYQMKVSEEDSDFEALDLGSETYQPLASSISHGTHVASIALASFDKENSRLAEGGTPPKHLGLYGVTIPAEVTQNTSGSTLGGYVLSGIRQAMLWNDALYADPAGEDDGLELSSKKDQAPKKKPDCKAAVPLVINFSYGFHAGPKDGTHQLCRAIGRMIDARNAFHHCRPTALVLPMGNDDESHGVADAIATRTEPLELDWVVLPDDRTSSFLEIYAKPNQERGDADFEIELVPPDRNVPALYATTRDENQFRALKIKDGLAAEWGTWPVAGAAEHIEDPVKEPAPSWARRGFIALGPTFPEGSAGTVPAGAWKLRIQPTDDQPIQVLIMVQRDDQPGTYPMFGRQSYLESKCPSIAETIKGTETGSWGEIAPPLSEDFTCSILASTKSEHVFAVGAGMGSTGDGIDPDSGWPEDQDIDEASPYAASGPRWPGREGPEYSGQADRSRFFRGTFGACTYSGAQVALSGSSAAAPELAGLLAAEWAHKERLRRLKGDMVGTGKFPVDGKRPGKKSGVNKKELLG